VARFAVIVDGIVTNLIAADTLADAEEATNSTCVPDNPSAPAWIGLSWDGTSFAQPTPTE